MCISISRDCISHQPVIGDTPVADAVSSIRSQCWRIFGRETETCFSLLFLMVSFTFWNGEECNTPFQLFCLFMFLLVLRYFDTLLCMLRKKERGLIDILPSS